MEILDLKSTATLLSRYYTIKKGGLSNEILFIYLAQGAAKLQELKVRSKRIGDYPLFPFLILWSATQFLNYLISCQEHSSILKGCYLYSKNSHLCSAYLVGAQYSFLETVCKTYKNHGILHFDCLINVFFKFFCSL